MPGIGATTEQRLWEAGYADWDSLYSRLKDAPIGGAVRSEVKAHLEASIQGLESGDHAYFQKRLGARHAWRAFSSFRSSCCYLDIETNGGSSRQAVTVIGLYDGQVFTSLIKDRDLEKFPDLIAPYKMIVTFFGSGFDLPMLERRFPTVRFDQIHLDLCPAFRQIGVMGGLKQIERNLGIQRSARTVGLTGYDAVKLWARYHYLGDESALELLAEYNREDVVNMERLAEYATERLRMLTLLGQGGGAPPRSVGVQLGGSRRMSGYLFEALDRTVDSIVVHVGVKN